MSATDGICLHQITGALEKIKKSIEMDLQVVDTAADWSIMWRHMEEVEQLIEDINNA